MLVVDNLVLQLNATTCKSNSHIASFGTTLHSPTARPTPTDTMHIWDTTALDVGQYEVPRHFWL